MSKSFEAIIMIYFYNFKKLFYVNENVSRGMKNENMPFTSDFIIEKYFCVLRF